MNNPFNKIPEGLKNTAKVVATSVLLSGAVAGNTTEAQMTKPKIENSAESNYQAKLNTLASLLLKTKSESPKSIDSNIFIAGPTFDATVYYDGNYQAESFEITSDDPVKKRWVIKNGVIIAGDLKIAFDDEKTNKVAADEIKAMEIAIDKINNWTRAIIKANSKGFKGKVGQPF